MICCYLFYSSEISSLKSTCLQAKHYNIYLLWKGQEVATMQSKGHNEDHGDCQTGQTNRVTENWFGLYSIQVELKTVKFFEFFTKIYIFLNWDSVLNDNDPDTMKFKRTFKKFLNWSFKAHTSVWLSLWCKNTFI